MFNLLFWNNYYQASFLCPLSPWLFFRLDYYHPGLLHRLTRGLVWKKRKLRGQALSNVTWALSRFRLEPWVRLCRRGFKLLIFRILPMDWKWFGEEEYSPAPSQESNLLCEIRSLSLPNHPKTSLSLNECLHIQPLCVQPVWIVPCTGKGGFVPPGGA